MPNKIHKLSQTYALKLCLTSLSTCSPPACKWTLLTLVSLPVGCLVLKLPVQSRQGSLETTSVNCGSLESRPSSEMPSELDLVGCLRARPRQFRSMIWTGCCSFLKCVERRKNGFIFLSHRTAYLLEDSCRRWEIRFRCLSHTQISYEQKKLCNNY